MTLSKIASQVAKLEGKRSQTSIGNIRETLKCLMVLEASMRVADHFKYLDMGNTEKWHHGIESECFGQIRLSTAELAEKAYVKELKRRAKEAKAKAKAELKK